MNRIFFIFNLVLVCLISSQTLCFATTDSQISPDVLFEQGSTAVKGRDYEKGLILFLKAREQGLDTVSLSYNIGVCAYKLGDYDQARMAFLEVSRESGMAALAYYNLGLIGMKEHDQTAARSWFDKTIATTTDAKLKNMAGMGLDRLISQAKPSWFGFASLGGGYDDNVKIVADTATMASSGTGDSFSELLAIARGPLFSPDSHFNLQLNGYYRNYFNENDYDYSSFGLKFFHKGKILSWQSEIGADYSYSFLAAKQYARIPSGFVELRKEFSTRTFFRTRYTFSYIDMLAMNNDLLSGTRNRWQLEAGRKWGRNRASFEYILELNDRDNPDESPTRDALKFKISIKPAQNTTLNVSAGYRQSCYEISGAADRDDELALASLRLAYNVTRDWLVGAEYNYENNQSSDASFEYTRNIVLLNVTRNF